MKKSIHFVSSFEGSIGEITNDLYNGLRKDFVVTRETLSLPTKKEILLSHLIHEKIHNECRNEFESFEKKVLIQPIDGTTIQEKFINYMNEYDLIITPSKSGKKIMENSGVKTKIIIIPNFFKNDEIILKHDSYIDLDKDISGKIVFYHESKSNWNDRKNIEFMYEAFVRAFSNIEYHNKVVLIHKDYDETQNHLIKEEIKNKIINLQKSYKYPVSIIKISQNLSKEKLKNLWVRMNFFLSFSKIEGFCIPMLRAIIQNKTVICLENEFSGYNDFLDNSNSIQIPSSYLKAGKENFIHTKESLLAECNLDNAIKFLNKSLEFINKNNHINKEKYLYENVLEKYSKSLQNL